MKHEIEQSPGKGILEINFKINTSQFRIHESARKDIDLSHGNIMIRKIPT